MKPNKEHKAGTKADSEQKVEDASVRQHSSKPNVIGSFLSNDKNASDIKETDLRIGNVIYYQSCEDGLLPNIVDHEDLKWLSERPESFNETFKPIPINFLVLEKLGWTIFHDGGDFHLLSKNVGEWGVFLITADSNGLHYEHRNQSCGIDIKYYHQLENVFHFTTGKFLDDQLEDLEIEKLVNHVLSDGSNTDDMPF